MNTGEIEAKEIELTMHSAVEVLTQVVNNEGILRARRLTKEGGVVRLDAGAHGEVHVGGVVDVSGDDGQAGGQVIGAGSAGGIGRCSPGRRQQGRHGEPHRNGTVCN